MQFSLREVVGVILWWAEGSKSRPDLRWKNTVTYPIEITNTDPKVINCFLDYLVNDLGTERSKIKLQIQIHEDNNKEESETYWSKITGIPKTQFNKTIVRPIGNKKGKTKGTCKIRFNDKQTYQRLSDFLEKVLVASNNGV